MSEVGVIVPGTPTPPAVRRAPAADLIVDELGIGESAVPYEQAWELQRSIHADVVAGQRTDTVLLLEHPPVYTAGRRTEPGDRPTDGTPVIDVDRGGRITWHGPGQLVGYPIVALRDPYDVVAHVRRLEEVLIATCHDLGLADVTRIPGRSGVWLMADHPRVGTRPARKIAAIGVRVARGVTMHGFALNCDCDLGWFDRIVPCGIVDAGVTSLSVETSRTITVADAVGPVTTHLRSVFSRL